MNTLALGQGSFDLSRIGRRRRWRTVEDGGRRWRKPGGENRSFAPHGNTATTWLDKDKRGRERERAIKVNDEECTIV